MNLASFIRDMQYIGSGKIAEIWQHAKN